MVARKRWRSFEDRPNYPLRNKIRQSLADPHDVDRLLKDVHLLELALAWSAGITSSDKKSEKLAALVSASYAPLRGVQWVDAHRNPDICCPWVAGGLADKVVGRLDNGDH